VKVTASTTFTLHLSGAGGTQSYGAQVTVNAVTPAPSVNLAAWPILLQAGGGQVTLSWTSQGASSAAIGGVGTVPVTGSLVVTVTSSTAWVLTMTGPGGTASDTAVAVVLPGSPPVPPAPGLPKQPSLSQNYPNPFNGGTTIRYSLPAPSYVSIKVYNLLGAVIADLVEEQQNMGYHEVRFNSSGLSSGVYYCTFRTDTYMDIRKMIYLR